MRDNLLPPPKLFFRPSGMASEPAERIHRACNAAVWREESAPGRLRFAALAILWPALAMLVAIPWLQRNAGSVRRLYGKGWARQFLEIVGLAIEHRISPKYYYVFEFYLDAHRALASQYLMRYETKQVAFRLLRPEIVTTGTPIKNKILFARYCADRDLRAVPILMTFRGGSRDDGGPETTDLPERDLFVKRMVGKGGAGAERWNAIGSGRYRNTKGPELDAPALIAHFAELSRDEPILIQPALINHPDIADLSVGALCTVRILTCEDEHGGHQATNAAFRMSINPKSAVDNLHAGGIAAPVDLRTGRLGPASDIGLGPRFSWHDRHPISGAEITGRLLPFWEEAVALATRAHAAFSEWVVVGWDIAMLADGPCLIEGNKGSDLDIIQRTLRGPIGNGRFGELLAYNLERRIVGPR